MSNPAKPNITNLPTVGITGATGNVGRELVSYLRLRGYPVVCLVRRQVDLLCKSMVVGDLLDDDALYSFVAKIDVCIHLAAHVNHASASQYRAVNVEGTRRICDAILARNPRCRLLYCSTIAALRIPRWFPIAATPYARSKREASDLIKQYQRERGLEATIVYPGLVYGPGDTKFLPAIMEKLNSRLLFFVSQGDHDGPLIYMSDLCELLRLVASSTTVVGKEYIAVKNHPNGIHDFISLVARQLGEKPPTLVLPKSAMTVAAIILETLFHILGIKKSPPISRRVVDVLSINLTIDSRAANMELGWSPKVAAEEGVCRFMEWTADRYDKVKPSAGAVL